MVGLIGWFLGASARSVDRWLLLDGLITGLSVDEAMEAELETISPQLTLDTFAVPVLDGSLGPALAGLARRQVLVGILGAAQLRGVPRSDWPSTRTSDVMIDVADLPLVSPEESLSDGLERLRTSRLDGLPVLDGAALRGVLTRRSIAVALRAKADLQRRESCDRARSTPAGLLSVGRGPRRRPCGRSRARQRPRGRLPVRRAGPRARRAGDQHDGAPAVGQLGDGWLRDPGGGHGRGDR